MIDYEYKIHDLLFMDRGLRDFRKRNWGARLGIRDFEF